jgi:hypothetical protein
VLLQGSQRTLSRLVAMQSGAAGKSSRWRGLTGGAGVSVSVSSGIGLPAASTAPAEEVVDHVTVNVGVTCMQSVVRSGPGSSCGWGGSGSCAPPRSCSCGRSAVRASPPLPWCGGTCFIQADVSRGKFLLIVGDECGEITLVDIKPVLDRIGVEPLAVVRFPPVHSSPSTATWLRHRKTRDAVCARPCFCRGCVHATALLQTRQPPSLPSYSAHRRFLHVAGEEVGPPPLCSVLFMLAVTAVKLTLLCPAWFRRLQVTDDVIYVLSST